MNELEGYRMQVESEYDDYLYKTEHRGMSYGELAYIGRLNKKELEALEKEIENEMRNKCKQKN